MEAILKEYLSKNSRLIDKIVFKLLGQNRDYSKEQIHTIVVTEVWKKITDNKNLSEKSLYLSSLSRILEEKGYVYHDNELYKPFHTVEEEFLKDLEYPSEDFYDKVNKSDMSFVTNTMLEGLNQDQVFVIALSFGLSTPSPLKGKYKEFLDNVEDIYYVRPLTHKEIAKIMDIPVNKMLSLRRSAMTSLVKRYRKKWESLKG